MKLQRNMAMDYLEVDEDSMVVFNPKSGDTHFLDGVGMDILEILIKTTDFEELILTLSKQYEANEDEMRADVIEFVDILKSKEIVIEL